jgi:hypothetical protein
MSKDRAMPMEDSESYYCKVPLSPSTQKGEGPTISVFKLFR